MKKTALLVAPLLLSACSALATDGDPDSGATTLGIPPGTTTIHFGPRGADGEDDTDFGPVLELNHAWRDGKDRGWEAGLAYSQHQELFGNDEDIDVFEALAGRRWTFGGLATDGYGALPYAAVGLSALLSRGRGSDLGAVGAYGRGGLALFFGGFTAGIEARVLGTTGDHLRSAIQGTVFFGWSH